MKKSMSAILIIGVLFFKGALASDYLANTNGEVDGFAAIGMGPGIGGTPAFQQVVVAGTDHLFDGEKGDLLKYVQARVEDP